MNLRLPAGIPISVHHYEVVTRRRDDTLTAREQEILRLAVEGRTNAEIDAQFAISPRTVEAHRAHVMRKLGLRTPTDLVRYRLRRGIVPLEE